MEEDAGTDAHELLAVFQVDVLVLRELPIRGPLRLRFIPGGGWRSRRDADANARAARQPARQRRASTRGAKRGRWRTRARDDAGGDAATRRGETDDADETTERRYDAFTRAVDEYEDVEEAEEEEEDDGEEARRWAAMLGKRRDE